MTINGRRRSCSSACPVAFHRTSICSTRPTLPRPFRVDRPGFWLRAHRRWPRSLQECRRLGADTGEPKGMGAVPVWFVKIREVQAILAGATRTTAELLAGPSVREGLASLYEEVRPAGSPPASRTRQRLDPGCRQRLARRRNLIPARIARCRR